MSISTIPDPKFVNCKDCTKRRKKTVLKKSGRGKETLYFCIRNTPWKQLYGQKGCVEGEKEHVFSFTHSGHVDIALLEKMDNIARNSKRTATDTEVAEG